MNGLNLTKIDSISSFKSCQEDIEELSSVCTDSISFVTARTAISQAFCRYSCAKNFTQTTCKKWNVEERNQSTVGVSCSRMESNVSKGTFRNQECMVDDIHLKNSIPSFSTDQIDQECFMFAYKGPRPCFCWKRSFFGCEYCESRFCWTWPGWRFQPYYENISTVKSKYSNSYYPYYNSRTKSSIFDNPAKHYSRTINYKKSEGKKSASRSKLFPAFSIPKWFKKDKHIKKRLVMEEAERKEESERWRERGDRASEVSTLQVKRPWVQNRVVTTRAILEGARNLSSNDTPVLNGILSRRTEGNQSHRGEQVDPDDKPPKLVVNLNHSDKASQIPEPLPAPEPEIESKTMDEADGIQEQENSCLIDCLYVTLQCCDCSIM